MDVSLRNKLIEARTLIEDVMENIPEGSEVFDDVIGAWAQLNVVIEKHGE
ncbi:hypothetical protein DCCM_3228 [Desulfocucumis palustris]|uniref:Uncharacterized protein n=1 Tax=Desulfocucumis palustris TaxID=1898651 RepID=A0A2L2XIQ3_9FIRM|nr:hypothetical protein [Desulfocucumis palustris]GBF34116.1 hypothetical protein DCCM_3228 [Desulfocucumis palustris]